MPKLPVQVKVTEYVEKIANLTFNEINPRKIDRKAYDALKKSLKEFPEMKEIREVVIDETNTILGGHQRIHALRELGYVEVKVRKVEGLTEKQKREFIIKDNASAGDWDTDILANLWEPEELADWGVPKFKMGGFGDEEETKEKPKPEPKFHECPACGHEFSE